MFKKLSLLLFVFALASSSPAQPSDGLILGKSLLSTAGLEYKWQSSISLNENEKVSQMWLVGGNLYVLTNTNYMYCFDRAEGISRFGRQIAPAGLPVFKPDLIGDKLMLVAANNIVEIDPNIGTELGVYDPGFTSVNRSVRQSNYLFMISAQAVINAVSYEDKLARYQVSAEDGSGITSLVATNGSAIFATDSGIVASFDISRRSKNWQFQAKDAITADVALAGEYIYVSSTDTNVYKLWVLDGSVQWIFRSGGSLIDSVRTGENVVYQYAKYKGLYCIDAADGKKLWLEPKGLDVLTEVDNKAYIFTSDKMLAVMDNQTGQAIKYVNFAAVENFVINSDDNKLYIADGTGKIACINIVRDKI